MVRGFVYVDGLLCSLPDCLFERFVFVVIVVVLVAVSAAGSVAFAFALTVAATDATRPTFHVCFPLQYVLAVAVAVVVHLH